VRKALWPSLLSAVFLLATPTAVQADPTYDELFQQVVIPADSAFQFPDVATHWARTSLSNLAVSGIMSGSAGLMQPDRLITRAEFITLLDRATEIPVPRVVTERPFRDVPVNAWYAPYIAGAYAFGITSGMGDGTFQPDRPITRAEIVALLNNAVPFQGTKQKTFWDVPDGKWYTQAVNRLAGASIIGGYDDGGFHPEANATRAEVAVMLDHILQTSDTAWGVGSIPESDLTLLVEQYIRQGADALANGTFPANEMSVYTAGLEYEQLVRTDSVLQSFQQAGGTIHSTIDQLSTSLLYNGSSVAAVQATATVTTTVHSPDGTENTVHDQRSAIFFIMKSGVRNQATTTVKAVIYASTPWRVQSSS
jgi:hypothetical protein